MSVKAKQIGVNTWKVGSSVVRRDYDVSRAAPFHVAGCLPRQSAQVATFNEAVAIAADYSEATKAAQK